MALFSYCYKSVKCEGKNMAAIHNHQTTQNFLIGFIGKKRKE
jgi:hypothetical protein